MDNSAKMRASVEWMSAKYAEMNDLLFNGKLGGCNFNIFTTGRGSQGGVLGWFKIKGRSIKVNRYNRDMYKVDYYGDKTYVNAKNFYDICQPTIELNGHYSGTEDSLTATLVHEMCHYYTYMYGRCPKQGHGPEFRSIAQIVSSRSNGMLTVQKVASAEEMAGYELDADMQARKDAREASKKNRMIIVLVFKKDGSTELSITTNKYLADEIVYENTKLSKISLRNRDLVKKIIISNDSKLVELFYNMGFRRAFRTYRYWNINVAMLGGENFIEKGGYNYKLEYSDDNKVNSNEPTPSKTHIFSIRTSNGIVEIPFNGDYSILRKKLEERFPKMSYDAITKVMYNKANYKIMENRMVNQMEIVESIINEFIENEFGSDDDAIDITPEMNLGKMSPLEEL